MSLTDREHEFGIPGRVIASFPERQFQFWLYRVGHGQLLVRSPNVSDDGINVDLMFEGVEFVSLPRFMFGVKLEVGGVEDAERLDALVNDRLRSLLDLTPTFVFVLISENRRYLVVAGRCWVREHGGDSHDDPFIDGGTAWIEAP